MIDDEQEAVREAAHVFLDMVSVIEPGVNWAPMVTAATPRLLETGALKAEITEDGRVDLVAASLIGGMVSIFVYLVDELSIASGTQRDDLIVHLREYVDRDAARG